LGNLSAENVSVTLQLPSAINTTDNLTKSAGKINQTNSKLLIWTLNGTKNGTYTINITASSADGRFNITIQPNIVVRYGNLVVSLDEDETPSSKSVNSSFDVYIKIKNTGNWAAFIDEIEIKVGGCGSPKTINPSEKKINKDSTKSYHASGFKCTSTGDKNIYVKLSGVENSTNQYSDFEKIGEITITGSSTQNNGNGNENPATYYDISFEKFEINNVEVSKIEILQGGAADLKVKVKNTGNAKLHNSYLSLFGISESYYNIDYNKDNKRDLNSGKTLDFEIHFSIPEDFEPKDYNLTIKFISDEYNKSKKITLKVKKVSLKFLNLQDINITQGEEKNLSFKVKNEGDATLHNLYLILSGIDENLFKITELKINLSKNSEKTYTINFTIPKTKEIGVKELILKAISDERNFTEKFNLTILPCEEEKIKINKCYKNLTFQFDNLFKKFEEAKKKGKNISSIEQKINNANQTLNQIKNYIEQGNYIEAKKLIDSLREDLNSIFSEIGNLKEKGGFPLLIIGVIVFVLILLGVILFYTFIPKKGYLPGKGYIFKSNKSNFGEKIKNIFKKFKRIKSEEEILRKKKLAEWRRYYDGKRKKQEW